MLGVRSLARLTAALIACGCLLTFVSSAGAFVYWADGPYLSIGRSALDGTGARDNAYTGLGPETCSVVSHDGYLYYGGNSSIGRVPISGGTPDNAWIQGASNPCAIAIYGNYIYWVNETAYYSGATGSIGRANLTGPQNVHQDFITNPTGTSGALDQPCGLTANTYGIYWTNSGGAIGYSTLDGSTQATLIPNADAGCSITQNGDYLYWETAASDHLSPNGNTIARAFLNGAAPNLTWATDLGSPCGLASDSHYLYFGASGGVIDRIDIDSPSLQSSETQLDTGQAGQCGVAVDDLFEGSIKVTGEKSFAHGVLGLTLNVSAPGRVIIKAASGSRPLLKTASVKTSRAGRVLVRLVPTSLARYELRSQRRVLARLAVSYLPTGGIASPIAKTVTLRR